MNKPNIFLCSDWHLSHNKEFCYKERGFTSPEEMNLEIIKRHNSLVKPNDIVYHLGDCVMSDTEAGIEYMKQLNGQIYLAIGNHDTDNKIKKYLELSNIKEVQFGYRIKHRKISLLLSHYPQLVANFDDPTPVWSIAGHTHAKTKFYNNIPQCYNVCMDAHNCYPILLDNMIDDIKNYRKEKILVS